MIEIWKEERQIESEPTLVDLILRQDWRMDKWIALIIEERRALLEAGETPESLEEALEIAHLLQDIQLFEYPLPVEPEPRVTDKRSGWRSSGSWLRHRKQPQPSKVQFVSDIFAEAKGKF